MRTPNERRNAALLTNAIIAGLSQDGIRGGNYNIWVVRINGCDARLERGVAERFPRINTYSLEYSGTKFDRFSITQSFRIGHARRKALKRSTRIKTKSASDLLVENLGIVPNEDMKRAAKQLKTWVK